MPEQDLDSMFADPTPGETAEGVEEPQEIPQEPVEGQPEQGEEVEQTEQPTGLEGSPFKDASGAVKAWKDLQRYSANQDRTIKALKQELIQTRDFVKRIAERMAPSQPAHKEQPASPDVFFQKFWQDPYSPIGEFASRLIDERMAKLDERLAKLDHRVGGFEVSSETQGFLSEHPELTQAEEDEIVEVIRENPWVKNVPNRLQVAYSMWVARNPEKAVERKKAVSRDLSSAKANAGLGGKRSATPVKAKGDEFDEVLELDRALREPYKR